MNLFLIFLFLILVLGASIYLCFKKENHCSKCRKKYQVGLDQNGNSIWLNKFVSKNFQSNGTPFGDQSEGFNCYCKDCYVELFKEEPK